jgi:sugar phosphate isomerase/epimerase
MSTGCVPLLKAAPEPEQIADRLDGGGWRGLELCLAAKHVASDEALDEAIRVSSGLGVALTAEAPVGWPSGAFVRVDRLDEEARAGIDRSARFAAEIGSPVLTIHLFVPLAPDEFRADLPLGEAAVEEFLRYYADLDYRTIGEVLEIETGTVSATLAAAHNSLRDAIEGVRT